MASFSCAHHDRDFIIDTMRVEPHQQYEVMSYGPGEGDITIAMSGRSVTVSTALTRGQVDSLKQCRYVALAFTRLGDTLGYRVITA